MAVTLKTFFTRWIDDITTNKAVLSSEQRMEIVNANIYGRDREEEEARARQVWQAAGRATEMEGGIPDDHLPKASENRHYNPLHLPARFFGKLKQLACDGIDELAHRFSGSKKGSDGKWPPAKSGGVSGFFKGIATVVFGIAEAACFILLTKPAELIDKVIDRNSSDARLTATLPSAAELTPRAITRPIEPEMPSARGPRPRDRGASIFVATTAPAPGTPRGMPAASGTHRKKDSLEVPVPLPRSGSKLGAIKEAKTARGSASPQSAVRSLSREADVESSPMPTGPSMGRARVIVPPIKLGGLSSTAAVSSLTGVKPTTVSELVAPSRAAASVASAHPEAFDALQVIGRVARNSDPDVPAMIAPRAAQRYRTSDTPPTLPPIVRRPK